MSESDRDRANRGVVGGVVMTAVGVVLLLIGVGGSDFMLKLGTFCAVVGLGVVASAAALNRRSL